MTTDEAGRQAAQMAPKRSLGRKLLTIPEVGVLSAVIVAFVIFYIADKSIADPKTLQIMAQQGTFIGLAAFGMIFLMIAGEIDLSSGAVAGLAAVIAGMLVANAGWPQWAAYLVGILAALAGGANQRVCNPPDRYAFLFRHVGHEFHSQRPADLPLER